MTELAEKSEHELQAIYEESARLLKMKSESRRQSAILQIQEIAKSAELTIHDLRAFVKGWGKSETPTDVTKTYVNPQNSAETWDGVGRQPRWVKTALKTGKTLEQLEAKAAE